MKRKLFISLLFIFFFSASFALSQGVRKPICDGMFYRVSTLRATLSCVEIAAESMVTVQANITYFTPGACLRGRSGISYITPLVDCKTCDARVHEGCNDWFAAGV